MHHFSSRPRRLSRLFRRHPYLLLISCYLFLVLPLYHLLVLLNPDEQTSVLPFSLHPYSSRSSLISNRTTVSIDTLLHQPFASDIIVSESLRLIYCPIPKAASTNWKYLIRKLHHIPSYSQLPTAHNPNTSSLLYLSDYSPAEAHALLNNPAFFKFTFVRHPYHRLLSAYMDKFRNQHSTYLAQQYVPFLAALFSWRFLHLFQHPLHSPHPSFRAFLHAILRTPPQQMNPHWRPQTILCGLGVMPYDFVGKMEHLSRDVQSVLSRLGLHNVSFPTHDTLGFPPSGASPELASFLYSTVSLYKVRTKYAADFALLDYH